MPRPSFPPSPPPPGADESEWKKWIECTRKHSRNIEDNFNIFLALIITTALSVFLAMTIVLVYHLGFFTTMRGYSIISLLAVAFSLTVWAIHRFLSRTRKGD